MAYLTLDGFKTYTVLPNQWIDAIEAVDPGFTEGQLTVWSDWIDSRLRKRYAAPFVEPVSETLKNWLARIVTVRVMLRRGVDSTDAQFAELTRDADEARAEIREAAEATAGLFDLPLRDDGSDSAIVRGTPLVYSEQSPYVGGDLQAERAYGEDQSRWGTGPGPRR